VVKVSGFIAAPFLVSGFIKMMLILETAQPMKPETF
jgi:hypothetical protein